MAERIRRVVTGHDGDGRAVFISDGEPPRSIAFNGLPGLEFHELWATEEPPSIPVDETDPTLRMSSFLPASTGSRFRVVRFPSGLEVSKMVEKGFDPVAFRREYAEKIPGLAETHELDNPGMHTTETIDYGIVLSGEIYLELDDKNEVHLKAGDCIVQNGTRHGWRNRSNEACLVAFIMIGAKSK